jgi:hypothetical protein
MSDLHSGIIVNKKVDGEWSEEKVPYEETLKGYCMNVICKKVFLWKYKSMKPIEEFPSEEKTEWKKFVNELFPNTTPQFRMDAVRIIHTISNL